VGSATSVCNLGLCGIAFSGNEFFDNQAAGRRQLKFILFNDIYGTAGSFF
jgi:hypothetical protein